MKLPSIVLSLRSQCAVQRAKIRKYLRMHRVHALAGLTYTGHEIAHARDEIFIAILVWVAICEFLVFLHGD